MAPDKGRLSAVRAPDVNGPAASSLVRALPCGISCTGSAYERTSRRPSSPNRRRQVRVIPCTGATP